MKQLKVAKVRKVIRDLPDNLPIVIVGEQQLAVGIEVVYQDGFDDGGEVVMKPVAVMVQLIPA